MKEEEIEKGDCGPQAANPKSIFFEISSDRTQELPVAVYFGLRKKNDLRMYRAPRGERPLE